MSDWRERVGKVLAKYFKIGHITLADYEVRSWQDKHLKPTELERLYAKSVWTYVGVNKIATTAASVPMKVYRVVPGKDQEVQGHPFIELIENPNEFMTRFDLIELLIIFLEHTGNGYWLFDDGASGERTRPLKLRDVKEIWPLPSHMIRLKSAKDTLIAKYNYRPDSSGKGQDLSTEEVFRVIYPNPLSMLYGQGSIEAGLESIKGEWYAEFFNNQFFRKGGIPPLFLKTDKSLTTEQRDEIKKSWSLMYAGVQNAHKMAILEGGLEFAVTTGTPKDAQFAEFSKITRHKILGALGVPPLLVGSEDAKYDNAEQQKQVFWEYTMFPKLRRIAAALTRKMHHLGEDKSLYVAFDTSQVKALQDDYLTRAKTAEFWAKAGVPVNDLISVFGPPQMKEVEGGDVGLVLNTMVPLAQVIESEDNLEEPEGTPEDAPAENDNASDPSAAEGEKAIGDGHNKRLDDYHWKRFIALQEPGFRRMRAALRKQFKSQRATVLAGISERYKGQGASADVLIFDVNEETKKMVKNLKGIVAQIYVVAGKQTVDDAGGGSFNVGSPLAQKYVEKQVFKFSHQVNETSKERLRQLLNDKIAEGATQSELTDAIAEEFNFYERYRAARIARTESARAYNAGILDGMKQAGVEVRRWISSRDAKVRDTHAIADGQEVDVGTPFDVGGFMLDFPSDPDGPPEETINCRCATRSVIGGKG